MANISKIDAFELFLDNHSIGIRRRDDKFYALSVSQDANGNTYEEWIDMTDWEFADVKEWMGY